jgi:cell division protein FtsQ
VERQPVAFALQPNGLTGLVDADGVLLSMPAAMMAQRHYSFPVVSGINTSDSLESRRSRMAVYQRLLTELDAGGQNISGQISDVDLSDPEDLSMRMQDDPTLLVIGQEHFLERYQSYRKNIAAWRQQHPDLVSVDLRIEQHAVLSMPVGTNVAQAAAVEENAAVTDEAAESHPSDKNKDVARVGYPAPKAVSSKTQAKAKPVKKPNRAAGKAPTKGKNSLKTVNVKAKDKKSAAVKSAALTSNKQRSTATRHPATTAGMGQ